MNKQSTIIIIILLVLGLLGIFMLVSNGQNSPESISNQEIAQQSGQNMEIDLLDPINFLPEAPQNSVPYSISEATVNYTAQKRFLTKADDVVVGSTNEVDGIGWYNEELNSFAIAAYLDFANIASPSSQRDADIIKLFADTNVLILAQVEEDESLIIGEEATLQVPILLTINGVQRSQIFDVTVTLTNEGVTASGQTSILMSDYGINPPSLIEVFTVDDEIVISFEVTGTTSAATENVIEEKIIEEEMPTEEEAVIEEEIIVEE